MLGYKLYKRPSKYVCAYSSKTFCGVLYSKGIGHDTLTRRIEHSHRDGVWLRVTEVAGIASRVLAKTGEIPTLHNTTISRQSSLKSMAKI